MSSSSIMDNDGVLLAITRLEKRTKRKSTSTADPAAVSRVVRAKSHLKFIQSQTIASCEKAIENIDTQKKDVLHLLQVLRKREQYYHDLMENRDNAIAAAKEQVVQCEAYLTQSSREDDLARLQTLVGAMRSTGLDEISSEDLERVYRS